jgi:hypothetical protein
MQTGLNFSHREAERLGLDWSEAFEAVLIHLRPGILRLSIYWDEATPSPGEFEFDQMHSLLDRAQARNSRVLLTLGFKPQRHPAYYPPAWLRSDGAEAAQPGQGRLAANLLMMLERAVALFADYDAIDGWELEHLPFLDPGRQPSGWNISRPLLMRALGVVREVDPRHRAVVLSHPGARLFEKGWREALVAADVLGCTLNASLPESGGAPTFDDRFRRRLMLFQLGVQAQLSRRFGRPLWITELDAPSERWWKIYGPEDGSFRLLQSIANAGVERVYLRGAEEWLTMRERGRPEAWDGARRLFRSENAGLA